MLCKPQVMTAGRHISQAAGASSGYTEIVWQHSSASFHGFWYICFVKSCLRCSQNALSLANTIKSQI